MKNSDKAGFLKPAMFAFFLFSFLINNSSYAQNDSATANLHTYKIGVFAPMYLDSIFTPNGTFKNKQSFPKFAMPGIDFIQGAQIALDSIPVFNNNIQASFYDTRSYTQPLTSLIKSHKLDSLNLLIGSVKDADFKMLADFAILKNIPFISATYPNDGGITGNPFLVILNSTLKAHCEAIYSYILQNHGMDRIYLCRKKGSQEDKVAAYFKALNEQDGKPLLKIQTINIDSSFSSDNLKNKLDSNRQSIIIGGSLDEGFASLLASSCYDLHQTYPITLIGMPNWDGFKSLTDKDNYEDFPIYFTSPYYNGKTDSYSRIVMNSYTKKYKGKPTDIVFKGFECTYLFTKLLLLYPTDFINHLNDSPFKVFSEFNFRTVRSRKDFSIPDYFENKHLYFIKILNGATSKAW